MFCKTTLFSLRPSTPSFFPSKRLYASSLTSKPLHGIFDSIPILGNSGFVRLVDHMPYKIEEPLYCDAAIAQMARISYGEGTKQVSSDKGLIRYLMRNYHTSPFEAVELKFHLKIPIFVERQLIRHRTANVNQISGRYSILPEDYYVPKEVRKQSLDNKQGSMGTLDENGNLYERKIDMEFKNICKNKTIHRYYKRLVDYHDVAREMARIILPQNIMTELYWKMDLHNLFHFLHLRKDQHAQQEIREVADAIFSVVEQLCPVSTQAFLDYRVNAIQFSACEILALREGNIKLIPTVREQKEFKDKLKKIKYQMNRQKTSPKSSSRK